MRGEGQPQPVRSRARRFAAVGAAGLGLAAALGAAWVFRIPLAGGLVRGQLSAQGVDGDFRIERLGLDGADLSGIRLGPEALPDASVLRAEIDFAWRGPVPAVDSIRLIEPRVRARLSEEGFSLGSLDAFFEREPKRRPELPPWRFEIVEGEALIETPFGALPITAASQGRIGEDFRGEIRLARASRAAGRDRLNGAEGELLVRSDANGMVADLSLSAADFVRRDASGNDVRISAHVVAPNDLARAAADISWNAEQIDKQDSGARDFRGALRVEGTLREDRLAFADWRASTRADAASLKAGAVSLNVARFESALAGVGQNATGRWTIAGAETRTMEWRAANVSGAGDIALGFSEDDLAVTARGALSSARAELSPKARADLMRAWPELGGTPLSAFTKASREGADRALQRFAFNAPFTFRLGGGESLVSFREPIEARAVSGAVARLRPLRDDAPIFSLQSVDRIANVAGVLEIGGGGLPVSVLTINRFSQVRNEPIIVAGNLTLPDWRPSTEARLAAANLQALLAIRDGRSELRLIGPLTVTGPAGAASVRDLALPLDLVIGWGAGFRVATRNDQCVPARFAGLALPGVELGGGAASICPTGGAFFAADAQDRVSGGFTMTRVNLAGHMAGEPEQRTQVQAASIVGRFSGTSGQMVLDVVADAPRMNILMAQERDIAIVGTRLTARTMSVGESWRAEGAFENGTLSDPALPANVAEIQARWTAEPRGEDALIRIHDGEAHVSYRPSTDVSGTARLSPSRSLGFASAEQGQARLSENDAGLKASAPDARPAFNPMRLRNVTANLIEGRLVGRGDIQLENRPLAAFEAVHVLESATGEAHVRARDLAFAKNGLQPYHISELVRGVVDEVNGPLDADVDLNWSPDSLTASGQIAMTNLSLASATLPIIEGVTGEIRFSDLFTLSTPPGQQLSIGLLNPGLEVRDGIVQFQLLGDGRVALESAQWPFAGGSLFVVPTTLTLGSSETRFNLLLREVDVAALLEQLKIPDLAATGRVEGEFPLVLTPRAAIVENGVLRAAEGGGAIAYTGRAREESQGFARVAFDALASFRYDSLALELNGDLSGDVVAAILFTGRNQAALDMSSMTPGGRFPLMGGRGIPFRFNVRVTAPFRTLARTAAGITDPGIHVQEAIDPVITIPDVAPVDPPIPESR